MSYGHLGKVLNKLEAESRNVPWLDVAASSVFDGAGAKDAGGSKQCVAWLDTSLFYPDR